MSSASSAGAIGAALPGRSEPGLFTSVSITCVGVEPISSRSQPRRSPNEAPFFCRGAYNGRWMPVVCPSCDAPPAEDATPGTPCLACGARMISVKGTKLEPGSIVDGRFEIREELGAGAMGVVYRATQL